MSVTYNSRFQMILSELTWMAFAYYSGRLCRRFGVNIFELRDASENR